MRYLVLCYSDDAVIAPHIIGEVVRDLEELALDRRNGLAGAIAGGRAVIATRDELLSEPIGRAALKAWDMLDDTEFDRDTHALIVKTTEAEDRPNMVALRIVKDEPQESSEEEMGKNAEDG